MSIILIILSTFLLIINLGAPSMVSTASSFVLVIEHLLLILCSWLLIKHCLKDEYSKYRTKYFNCFLLGYSISLLFLYLYWTPELVSTWATDFSAFDPVKYYAIAQTTVESSPDPALAYFPVSWIYVAIFKVLGIDPLVPLFVNVFAALYTTIILAKFVNEDKAKHFGYFAYLLLVPEIVCFNMMSAKDTICMICVTIIFVNSQEFLKRKFTINKVIITAIAFIALALARTSMSLAALFGILIFSFNFKKLNFKKILLLVFGILIFVIAFNFTQDLGSATNADDISERATEQISGDMENSAELNGQSSNSFARKLVPHNTVEAIVFGFIRSLCYVVIDPRFIKSPISIFIFNQDNKWSPLIDFTTLLMTICDFFIFFMVRKWKYRTENYRRLFIITAFYMLVVGIFNPLMIHIRYRVIYDLLFFALGLKSWLLYRDNKVNKMARVTKKYESR